MVIVLQAKGSPKGFQMTCPFNTRLESPNQNPRMMCDKVFHQVTWRDVGYIHLFTRDVANIVERFYWDIPPNLSSFENLPCLPTNVMFPVGSLADGHRCWNRSSRGMLTEANAVGMCHRDLRRGWVVGFKIVLGQRISSSNIGKTQVLSIIEWDHLKNRAPSAIASANAVISSASCGSSPGCPGNVGKNPWWKNFIGQVNDKATGIPIILTWLQLCSHHNFDLKVVLSFTFLNRQAWTNGALPKAGPHFF